MPRPIRKRLSLLLGGIFTGWFLIALFFDLPPADDSDLALPVRQIDPADNAYPRLRELVFTKDEEAQIDRIDRMFSGDEDFDTAYLETLLDLHAEKLDLFEKLALSPLWQTNRATPPAKTADLAPLTACIRLATLKRAEAARRSARGDAAGAIRSALVALRLVPRFQTSGADLIENAVVTAVAREGARGLVALLDHHEFDAESLATLARDLEEIASGPTPYATVLKTNYQEFKRSVLQLRPQAFDRRAVNLYETPGWLPGPLVFKKNRTFLLAAEATRPALATIEDDYQTFAKAVHAAVPNGRRERWVHLLSGNGLGFELAVMPVETLVKMGERDFERRTILGLLQLRVASGRLRADRGRWPRDLGELVPDYLASLPIDRMDGAPLRYRAADRLIYSVGNDGIDHSGITPGKAGSLNSRAEVTIELEPGSPPPWPVFPPPEP